MINILTNQKNFLLQPGAGGLVTKGDTVYTIGRERYVIPAGTLVIETDITMDKVIYDHAEVNGYLKKEGKKWWKVWD